jgi:rhodanese-related sulfurtransferase
MPVQDRPDGAPEIVFDPTLEVAPFTLFRRLQRGQAPLLVDVRPAGGALSLRGALPWPGEDWQPPADTEVVLVDDDGHRAVELARHFQAAGHSAVRALFGGLELWEFALDPQVVGAETFLDRA